jgi:hypothetical protein
MLDAGELGALLLLEGRLLLVGDLSGVSTSTRSSGNCTSWMYTPRVSTS